MLSIAQTVGIRVAQVAQQSWLLVVVPVLAAFFLKDGRGFTDVILSFIHAKAQREFLQGVLDDLNQMLAQFIRAQLTLAACSFVAYLALLGPLQVPYWLVLSSAGGAMEFIPVVGPLVAAVVILAVAFLTGTTLAAAADLPGRVATDSGLRDFSPRHGKEHGTPSAGGYFWSAGRRGNCRSARSLSFHPDHGPVCASYGDAGACTLKRKRFGPLNEYLFWNRNQSAAMTPQ